MAGKNSDVSHDRVYGLFCRRHWVRVGSLSLVFAALVAYYGPDHIFAKAVIGQSHATIRDYPYEGRDSRVAIRTVKVKRRPGTTGLVSGLIFPSTVQEVKLPNARWINCDGDSAATFRAKARRHSQSEPRVTPGIH